MATSAAEHAGPRGGGRKVSLLGPAGRLIKEVVKRAYAVLVIAVVVWLSFRAFHYLIVSLLLPAHVPAQIDKLPLRLDRAVLETEPETWTGLTATRHARTPLAHYHRIEGWFQPDRANDCIRSGCHGPMPHGQHQETRAFLNMHATSIHCGVCHMECAQRPLPLMWYDLHTGARAEPPALLRAYGWLLSTEGQAALAEPTPDAQQHLVKLLRAAATQAKGDPALVELADHVAAVRHTSDAFQTAVATVLRRLPLHFRGEYGAKLALRDPQSGKPILAHPGTEAAVLEFLSRKESGAAVLDPELLARVHPRRRGQVLECTACHCEQDALVDLRTAGYPPQRVEALHRPWVFRAIERMRAGQPLHLPGFVVPGTPTSATTQPDSP